LLVEYLKEHGTAVKEDYFPVILRPKMAIFDQMGSFGAVLIVKWTDLSMPIFFVFSHSVTLIFYESILGTILIYLYYEMYID